MRTVGINPLDNTFRSGHIYLATPENLPRVGGQTGVGVVVGSGNTAFKVGDRVFVSSAGLGLAADGTWREFVSAPASALSRVPAGIDDDHAAAFLAGAGYPRGRGRLRKRGGASDHEPVYRHQRVRLQGVEGVVLSQGPAGRGDAPLLRRAVPDGRDQQHVLPDSEDVGGRGVGGGGAGRVPVRTQGLAADHAFPAAKGVGGDRGDHVPGRGGTGRAPWAGSVSTAAEPEE